MSTTNGTKSLARVKEAKSLFTMALVNRKAVAERLIKDNPNELLILGSGWEGSYSLEDSLAAGALAHYLVQYGKSNSIQLANDEINAALSLWEYWKHDPVACLYQATHGQRLNAIGNHDDDFACCSELDKIRVVPTQREPGILCSF